MYKRTLPVIAAILLLALSTVLTSCGDDGDDDNGGETPATTSAATDSGGETAAPTKSTGETPPPPAGGTPVDGSSVQTPPAGTTSVTVNLTEYIVSPNPTSVAAGLVTFVADNIGGTTHELIVLRTDLAPDALPTRDDGSVDGEGTGFETIGESDDVPLQQQRQFTAELAAGNYVLICNVVQQTATGTTIAHYDQGMFAAFTVE